MNRWSAVIAGGVKVLNLVLSTLGVLAVLFLLVGSAKGMLKKDNLQMAYRGLKGENLVKEVIVERPSIKELLEMDQEKTRREESYLLKEQELAVMEQMLQKLRQELEDKGNRLDSEKQELEQQRKKTPDSGSQAKGAEGDAGFRSNVTLFSKMEAVDIATLMKSWGETPDDNKKIRMYLRALKPSLAAEVITALNEDAVFNKRDSDGKLRMNRILLEQ